MSERRDPDDDLADLLADLDRTLGDLRRELRDREPGPGDGDDDDRRGRRGGSDDDRGGRSDRGPTDREADRYGYRRRDDSGRRDDRAEEPHRNRAPRPPSFGEMLRFTDEYTIPTVISMLETTIHSLELLRRLLRLADPDRSAFDPDDGRRSTARRLAATNVGREALSGADRTLNDLRDALAGLPSDAESRDIVTDARDLIGEIESRVEAAERERRRSRYGYRDDRGDADGDDRTDRRDGREAGRRRTDRGDDGREDRDEPVTIDVSDGDEADEEESPRVDVDAELESIREEVRGRGDRGDDDRDADGDDAGADADDAAVSDDAEPDDGEGGSDAGTAGESRGR